MLQPLLPGHSSGEFCPTLLSVWFWGTVFLPPPLAACLQPQGRWVVGSGPPAKLLTGARLPWCHQGPPCARRDRGDSSGGEEQPLALLGWGRWFSW